MCCLSHHIRPYIIIIIIIMSSSKWSYDSSIVFFQSEFSRRLRSGVSCCMIRYRFASLRPSCSFFNSFSYSRTFSLSINNVFEKRVSAQDVSNPVNPLNAELIPICHLLALPGSATIVVVSRLRVKLPPFCCT